MRQMAGQKKVVNRWREMESKVADITELTSLAGEDDSLKAEIESEIEEIASHLDELELEMAFSGEYDARNAILAIHAGA